MTVEASTGAAPPAKGGRGPMMWIQGLACGALLTFAAPTALMVAVLFAPSVICAVAETSGRRGIARAVMLGCAAASLAPCWHLWLAGDHFDQALSTLSDPVTLLLAWGGGACAWALCQVLPVVLRLLWDMREAARGRAIDAELRAYREAWDIDPP